MKKIHLLFILTVLAFVEAKAQGKFSCTLSSDSIEAGNYIRLTYLIENIDGELETPDFQGIKIVSGPNTSSQMSIMNGKMSSRKKYEYILFLEEPGDVYLGTAALVTKNKTFEIEPVKIVVNPSTGNSNRAQVDQSRSWTKIIETDGEGNRIQSEETTTKPKRVLKRI